MKQGSLYETFIQLAALVFAFIVVQATYTTVIRPVAADIQAYQAEQQQVNEDFVPERSVFVILKDFEQQACITLMLWAVFIIGMKTQQTVRQRSLLERTSGSGERRHERFAGRLTKLCQTGSGAAGTGAGVSVTARSAGWPAPFPEHPQHSGCCSDDKRCL